ncbi:hypothetical protein Csa_020592, partial [Cucumis sativus]
SIEQEKNLVTFWKNPETGKVVKWRLVRCADFLKNRAIKNLIKIPSHLRQFVSANLL